MLSVTIRALEISARLIGFAAAVLTIALSVWYGSELTGYLFSEHSTWGEVGGVPIVLALRTVAAAWVMWGVLTFDLRQSLYLFFGVGIGCFLVLFGWYFMLVGPFRELFSYDNLPYLLALCDLLYVAAGLLMGCALLWPNARGRTSNDSL